MFNNQVLAGSSGQGGVTQQSLKFNDDESQYLSWTPASAGNLTTWTWSGWVKRCNLSDGALFSANYSSNQIIFSLDRLYFEHYDGSNNNYKISTNKLRDTSAWYHLVFVWDTSNATAADRMRMYINSERVTNFDSSSDPSLNVSSKFNTAIAHEIGHRINPANFYLDAYLAEVNFIDGQALDPTSFGETIDGYWKAKDYSGSYGTNGFRLTFEDDVVSEGFNTVTYRGTGATQSISGLGFAPDLVWTKGRDITQSHNLVDSVRGDSLRLRSDQTAAEVSATISLDADGFTVGTQTESNNSGSSLVAWCWDAGTGSAVSNTDGSITSSVKANPDYGFSIVSWAGNATAGATVGHGLSSPLELILLKDRSGTVSWRVYSSATGGTKSLYLNLTIAAATDATIWNNTDPTSSVFTIGNDAGVNASGNNYIAYCFHSVAGYSSFGSYTGNGSASGPTVTTGFRPAFVMVKRTDSTGDWHILDNTRSAFGELDNYLYPNLSDAEYAGSNDGILITDTTFQLSNTYASLNASGGTYIYMAFADTREAAFWKDVSGQGNHWTPNNLDYRDSLIDSPANNFAVLNPLLSIQSTFSEGNLKTVTPSNAGNSASTIAMSEGKWYAEFVATSSGTIGQAVGVVQAEGYLYSSNMYESTNKGIGYYSGNGQEYDSTSGSLVATGYGSTWTTGDVIGVAYDADTSQITFYKNGVSQGTVTLNSAIGAAYFSCGEGQASATTTFVANFGQDSTFSGARPAGGNTDANGIGDFAYAPPSGYLALCTANLPTPTIVDGSTAFSTALYTGTGATQSITGVGFQPDFVWAKRRSATGDHILSDSVRTAGKYLSSNLTAAEITSTDFGSFDSDGFTVNAVDQTGGLNASGSTYAAWNWKAGGTAVSNTDGSITSQVSANVDAGFSIVSYTGSTSESVGHGLGQAPECIFVKDRDAASSWAVYHQGVQDVTANGFLELNSTFAVQTGSNPRFLSGTAGTSQPTSTVFYVNNYSGSSTNNTGNDYIAYCFHSSDVCKVGSYTGNGSTDGTFVYTGFRPSWIMCRRSSSAAGWHIFDRLRPNAFNVINKRLEADNADAENSTSGCELDFLSNGFKFRGNFDNINGSGATHIYLAFAENPFKYANAR
jgi:hypothetical protein